MKRILTILALSLMCLTSNAQLVWKISGNGIKNPSYILGTHHGCPFNYCDSIPGLMKAFDKVDNIIGEINMIGFSEMSPERMQKMQAMMMMPADTSLLSLFNEEETAKVNAWLKDEMGASLEMLSVMKPMTIMVTVQNKILTEMMPELATMTSIDKYMQTLGQRKGKIIGELETDESSYPIFKRLIVALLCLTAVNAAVSCEGYDDYVKNLKSEYGYTVKKHNVKGSDIEAIEQALDKHEWQKYKQLTKDEAKAE